MNTSSSSVYSPGRISISSSNSSPGRISDFIEVRGNFCPTFNVDKFTIESPAFIIDASNNTGSKLIISLGENKIPISSDMELSPILDTKENVFTIKQLQQFVTIRFENHLVLSKWHKVITHGIVQAKARGVLHSIPLEQSIHTSSVFTNSLFDNAESRETMLRVMKRVYGGKKSPVAKDMPQPFPTNLKESMSTSKTTIESLTSSDDGSIAGNHVHPRSYNIFIM